MPVIVAVYHLGALQRTTEADLSRERSAVEAHMKYVAELASKKILYPITIRGLLAIISEQQ
jgi:hypothetical protein